MDEIDINKNELDTPVLWVALELIPALAPKMIAAGAIGGTYEKLCEAEVMAAPLRHRGCEN